MKQPVIIVGVGEIGGVFARAFLSCGHPVYPVNRGTKAQRIKDHGINPAAVVVAVAEKDLEAALNDIPDAWNDRIVLVQNELLPCDWKAYDLSPTVMSIWFEKKYPKDYKPIIPSVVFGPQAGLVKTAMEALGIETRFLPSEEQLLEELITKNLYILTTNICGLEVGGTVGELWEKHQDLAKEVAQEVLAIQFRLVEKEMDRGSLIDGMARAFAGDPEHKCMGRSAHARLDRALILADKFGLPAEKLRYIKQKTRSDR